jgi:hypothetical protein
MTLATLVLAVVSTLDAADVTGRWQAEFDTRIGRQKYLHTLSAAGDKVTGKASADIAGEKRETEPRIPSPPPNSSATPRMRRDSSSFSGSPVATRTD